MKIKIRNLYNSRNYQYAWFNEEGLTEQGQAFWTLHQTTDKINDSSLFNSNLHNTMDALLNELDSVLSTNDLQKTEMRITQHFFYYLTEAFQGKVQPIWRSTAN